MNRLLLALARHPFRVLGVVIALSAATLPGVVDLDSGELRLRYDPSTNLLLPYDDAPSAFYRRARRIFGNDETVIVALRADDAFTPEALGSLVRLSDRLEALPGVHHVSSLATVPVPRGNGDEIRIEPLLSHVPASAYEREALRAAALENPLLAGRLVSRDGRMTAIVVHFADFSDREFFVRQLDPEISRVAREEARGVTVHISGTPWVKVAQAGATWAALKSRLPLILAVLFGVLTLAFRTLRGVLLPVVTIGLAQLWTLALVGHLERPLNAVTVMVPLLLVILGLVYSVHVISAYYDELRARPSGDPAVGMVRALRRTAGPMLLAALTTAISLLVTLATPVRAMREFGWLSLVGILVAYAAAVVVTPALLLAFGRPRGLGAGATPPPPDWFERFARATALFVVRRRTLVVIAFALGLVAALAAASRVRISTDTVHAFPEDSPVRVDFDAINGALDGATSFSVVIDAGYREAFADPAQLAELESLQRWLEQQPEVGGTRSIADWLKLLQRAASSDEPGALAIPATRTAIGGLLLIGRGDEQDELLDVAWQRANLIVRTPRPATADLQALVERLETRLLALPAPMSARVTGQAIVFQSLWDDVAMRQAQSLALSLVVVYVILSILFVSPRAGLRALAPNVIPVAGYFAVLWLAGVPLNLATSVVGPLALGFALNDTLHYFVRFAFEARRLANEEAATVRALVTVGRPMTYSTLAVCLAFLALVGAPLDTLAWLGTTAAAALAIAWLCDFLLTPALCVGIRVVTLWDTLLLDLGPRPQASIPLLADLSTSQCRIVAQMAGVQRVRAGEELSRTGESGREMYLVIDGLLEASVETPMGRVVLGRFSRGDLLGEVGFYTARRSASLAVLENAHLLRLTQQSFERLDRRSPRIAAILYRNLSRIMAQRVINTTELIH
ncbi:MAG: MMPL family transporter [Myxococcota bacterium]